MNQEISTLPDGTVRMCLTQDGMTHSLHLRQQPPPC